MKKLWEKPNLVVLIRSRPEESVLVHCKLGYTGGGPDSRVQGCHAATSCNTMDDSGNCTDWQCGQTCADSSYS